MVVRPDHHRSALSLHSFSFVQSIPTGSPHTLLAADLNNLVKETPVLELGFILLDEAALPVAAGVGVVAALAANVGEIGRGGIAGATVGGRRSLLEPAGG